QRRVSEVEEDAATKRRIERTTTLGRRRILAQHWDDRPRNPELRRQLNPSVACRDKWRRIERLQRNKFFLLLYREAFAAFRSGLAAVFPIGTWLMRFRACVQISTA